MLKRVWRRTQRRTTITASCCAALLAGLALARLWPWPGGWLLATLFLAVGMRRRLDTFTLVCLAVGCLGLGLHRGAVMQAQFAQYDRLQLHKVSIVGRAIDDGVYGEHSQLTFGLTNIQVVAPYRGSLPGDIQVAGFGTGGVYRGDTVSVQGKLFKMRGNKAASISFADLRVLRRGMSPVDALRRKFAAGIESALPEPQASFGLGLLIGQRSTLPADTAQILLAVGLTHLIAVSGYNVTILINAARRLLGKRSAFQTAAGCLALTGLFYSLLVIAHQ